MPGPLSDDEDCRRFAENLKKMRRKWGMSQEDLGAASGYSASVIANIEGLHRPPTVDQGERFDAAFGIDGFFGPAAARIRGKSFAEPYMSFPEHERKADTLRTYQHSYVPGLLQTERYARASISTLPDTSAADVERLVTARLERQETVTRDNPPPTHMTALIDEGALRRPVMSPEVMYEQLTHVVEMSRLPHVALAVVPYTAGAHIGLMGACTIADGQGQPSTVFLEDLGDGRVTDDPVLVRRVRLRFESLQMEALSPRASRDLIVRMAEEQCKGSVATGVRVLIANPAADNA